MSSALLDGRFELFEMLSRNADTEVYRAVDRGNGDSVAVKLLRPSSADTNELLTRLLQEYKVLRRLDHPNVVRVLHTNLTADNVFYVVMEYLTGQTLAELVQTSGPLPCDQVADYLDAIASVLDAAHAMSIIHRDIKPSNVMIVPADGGGEIVKVMGFVFAKIQAGDAANMNVTQAGVAVGTPSYMSPEQAMGRRLTKLSDVYSLGVTLYTMLTGVVPFEAKNDLQRMIAHVKTPIPWFRERNPGAIVPESVELVVRWAMSKEIPDRPTSAGELARVFREAIQNPGEVPERPKTVLEKRSGTRPTIQTGVMGGAAQPSSEGANWMPLLVAAMLVAITLGVALGYYFAR